ncbi:hypothetical protein HDU76_009768 [Blyttiomyces sp. JEL0837]|nr:hypothetical protein HDU76_009768 [Blyttiomyces sp. JEL0837]
MRITPSWLRLVITSSMVLDSAFAVKTFGILSDAVISAATAKDDPYTYSAMAACLDTVSVLSGFICKWIFSPPPTYSGTQLDWYKMAIKTVMGDTLGPIFADLARPFPSVFFSLNDGTVNPDDPLNTQGIDYSEDQAGFLAGVAAGGVTNSSVVAAIGGLPVPAVTKYVQGFLKGVKYVNPTCAVLAKYVLDLTWSNVTIGVETAEDFMDQKADVIFGVAGGMGSAGIKYAASKQKIRVLIDSAQGMFYHGNRFMDVANGGISLAPCSSNLTCELVNKTTTVEDDNKSGTCSTLVKTTLDKLILQVSSRLRTQAYATSLSDGFFVGALQSSNRTWTSFPTFGFDPQGLQGHSISVLFNNIFLIYGGLTPTGTASNVLFKFEYDYMQWTPMQPVSTSSPPGITNHAAGFCNQTQELVIFGGTLPVSYTVSGDVWKYNYITNTWVLARPSGGGPGKRTNQAYAVIGDTDLYVWGGQDYAFTVVNDLWRFNIPTNAWFPIAVSGTEGIDYPEGRYSASMVAVNGTDLLLYGGSNGLNDGNVLWSFNIQSKLWTKLNPDQHTYQPIGLSSVGAVVLDPRRVLFVGGTVRGAQQDTAFIYNSGVNAWVQAPSINLPVASHGMVLAALNQSAYDRACVWEPDPSFSVCQPVNQTSVVLYGGAQIGKGVVNQMMIIFPEPEILPKSPSTIPIAITTVGFAVSGTGILFCVFMMVMLIMNRKHQAFRLASITFLSMYLTGACLAMIGIFIYNAQGVTIQLCSIGLWCFSIGCMILYSALAVKNYRVYIAFRRSKLAQSSKLLNDANLTLVVIFLNLVNVGVLFAFFRITPYEASVYIADGELWQVCASPGMNSWMWILLAPTASMILAGLFFSFETRNVVAKFNESAQMNASVYVTCLSLIVLIALNVTLKLLSIHFIS